MMQLQSQFLNFHRPTQPYAGPWNTLVTSLCDHMQVPNYLAVQCKTIFVTYLFFEMFCGSENLSSLGDISQSQFKSNSARGNVRSQKFVSFWSHTHSRRQCCSELSRLRSEDILSITSSINSELMIPDVYRICLLPPHQTAWTSAITQDIHPYL